MRSAMVVRDVLCKIIAVTQHRHLGVGSLLQLLIPEILVVLLRGCIAQNCLFMSNGQWGVDTIDSYCRLSRLAYSVSQIVRNLADAGYPRGWSRCVLLIAQIVGFIPACTYAITIRAR